MSPTRHAERRYRSFAGCAVPCDFVYRLYLVILCTAVPRDSVYRCTSWFCVPLYLVVLCTAVPRDSVYRCTS